MRSIATLEPNAGDTRYVQWYRQLQRGASDLARRHGRLHPGGLRRRTARVPRARPRPTRQSRKALHGSFQIVPSGSRPSYCLTRATVGNPGGKTVYPPLLDYCAPVLPGHRQIAVRGADPHRAHDGRAHRHPPPRSRRRLAGRDQRSRVPSAARRSRRSPERRAAFRGIIGTSFAGTTLLDPLLARHGSLTLALYHRNSGDPLELIGRAGAHPRGRSPGYSERLSLGEGWLVQVSGTADSPLAADAQGADRARASACSSRCSIFLLWRVLSRSRQRAWGLVGEKTDELEYRALHDPLTDLPNRILVLDRAEQILARGRRQDVPVTALFVDIDGFKQINDRYGHHAGDEVLRQVGARLKTVLRENDTVGRLGGDEFVMLIDSLGLDAAPELVAERILDVLRQPIRLSESSARAAARDREHRHRDRPARLGRGPDAGRRPRALQGQGARQGRLRQVRDRDADRRAGSHPPGDGPRRMRSPPISSSSSTSRCSTSSTSGSSASRRCCAGAIARASVIPPDAFIPIAEDSGLIVPIGRWVLEQACAQGAAWHAQGHDLNISVNVSARQLERPEFVEEVRAALHDSGLDPATLTLEITETVLMRKPETTALLLAELKGLGVRIAVDDFGTGYCSLAYLRQFPVDSLKIDRTFITGLALSSEAHALTHT